MIIKSHEIPVLIRGDWAARGLVAIWPMMPYEVGGNKVFDLSGNGNTGTFVGTAPSWTSGKFGSAVLLPGTDEGINCGQKMTVTGTTGLTISASVYLRSSASDYDTIAGQTTVGATNEEYVLLMYNNSFYFYVRAGGSGQLMAASGIVPLNTWVHIAVTLEPSKAMKSYYNGVLYGTDTADAVMGTPTIDFYIGTDSTESYPVDCMIDHLMLHGRALSASEIALRYREPFCMFEREPIELWVGSVGAGEPPAGIPILRRRIEAA